MCLLTPYLRDILLAICPEDKTFMEILYILLFPAKSLRSGVDLYLEPISIRVATCHAVRSHVWLVVSLLDREASELPEVGSW